MLIIFSDFWASPPINGDLNHGLLTKTRLNSYEESNLSSPESASGGCGSAGSFSNRSRISSGEDDLETWNKSSNVIKTEDWPSVSTVATTADTIADNDFDPSLTELNALLDNANNIRMEFQPAEPASEVESGQNGQQLEWTYLEPAQPTFNTGQEGNVLPNNTG